MLTSCIASLPIWETSTVSFILLFTPSPSSFVSSTSIASVVALCAISPTDCESCSTVLLSSFIDVFCSLEASNICPDTSLLLSACLCNLSETLSIEAIIEDIVAINFSTHLPITPISSLLFVWLETVKSPLVIVLITSVSFFTGFITIWIIRSNSTIITSIEITPNSTIIFLIKSKSW